MLKTILNVYSIKVLVLKTFVYVYVEVVNCLESCHNMLIINVNITVICMQYCHYLLV